MLTLGPSDTLNAQASQPSAITFTANGDVITAGVDQFGIISQLFLSDSATTVVGVSSGQRLIKHIALQNTTAINTTVKLWINGIAAVNSWFVALIPANGSALFSADGWSVYDNSGFQQYVGATGPAGTDGVTEPSFEFVQASPSALWTINHNLGYRPVVGVFSSGGVEVSADVFHISLNQTLITFNAPFAGFARLV